MFVKMVSFAKVLLWTSILSTSQAQEFNIEIEKRILERLDFYLGGPMDATAVILNFHSNGGFPHDMDGRDRDQFLNLAYGVLQPLVYIGGDDGLCTGYYWSNGYYREPGNSAYSVDNPRMKKHIKSCIDGETGDPTLCLLEAGSDYISCKDELGDESGLCEQMEICPNQVQCDDSDTECKSQLKWCRQYTIEKVPDGDGSTGLGYVPITNMCFDKRGRFSQTANDVVAQAEGNRDSMELTTCQHGNGDPVKRDTAGEYTACGGEGKICDTAFVGGYSSGEYDPRYRPWYMEVREKQKSVWLPPYPFFTLGIGITYAEPFYSVDEATGRNVFAGVLAVDYRLEDIESFLIENYENATIAVAIYEVADPHYLIATSTGSSSAEFFLTEDLSKPCPDIRGDDVPCSPVRISVGELSGNPMDSVLANAAVANAKANYPQELISFNVENGADEGFYVSQSTIYTQPGTGLSWRIVVISPGGVSETDTLTPGQPSFIAVCILAALGMVVCSFFFWVIFSKREEREIVYCDWRFTCAFIFGCILINLSSFAMLGGNSDSLCILRMWTFHLSLVMALSPLFVKVWRIWKLVGQKKMVRRSISNQMTIVYSMPMILFQVLILIIFTFVDPPSKTEHIEIKDGAVVQSFVCETNTPSFLITEAVYEVGLVVAGCILAYLTRNMKEDFGEAMQLIFAMYNIAFVGVILVIITQITNLDTNGTSVLWTIGLFWGTVFSTSGFVIPRLVQIRQRAGIEQNGMKRSIHISGLPNLNLDTKRYSSNGFRSSSNGVIHQNSGRSRLSGDYAQVSDVEEMTSAYTSR